MTDTITKPKRKRTYLRNNEAAPAIAERESFKNSTGCLRGVAYGEHGAHWVEAGWLNRPETDRFYAEAGSIRYIVFSFETPIAWWSSEHGWHIVGLRFSKRTSVHQGKLYLIPTWDAESIPYSLSDCKHWDTPGPDCSGPRVGKVVRDGVILCEGHYNAAP